MPRKVLLKASVLTVQKKKNRSLKNKMEIIVLSLFFLFTVSCSKEQHEAVLRQTISEYIKAVQNGDVKKVYELELPAYQADVTLEHYQAHEGYFLEQAVDSAPSNKYVIKEIRFKKDTAIILIELHLLGKDSIQLDSLTAIHIKERWFIPTFSSDINSRNE